MCQTRITFNINFLRGFGNKSTFFWQYSNCSYGASALPNIGMYPEIYYLYF